MQDFDTGPRFDSPQMAMRLNNAYAFYDGKPKLIRMLNDGYLARIYDPGVPDNGILIDVQADEKLDISSPELGFMNCRNGDCLYVYRRPLRQWHYLFEGNCFAYSLTNNRVQGCNNPLFNSKEFGNTLSGKYPAYNKLLKTCLEDEPILLCRAFDRFFALKYTGKKLDLYYRDEVVANYDSKERLWNLKQTFDYPTITDYLRDQGLEFGE